MLLILVLTNVLATNAVNICLSEITLLEIKQTTKKKPTHHPLCLWERRSNDAVLVR